ncbi:MAG: hypothetical protein K2X39_03675 [Silvanigrellaceae bacterium]|nr:hypothetical protein [Silvanigrellaceae bacterium]
MNKLIKLLQDQKYYFNIAFYIIAIVTLLLFFCHSPPDYRTEIMRGIFILLAALITAWFAFKQYKDKQLTLRLQKIYFEDTLLGLTKSMERARSETKKNMLLMENIINLAYHQANLHDIDIAIKREYILELFNRTSNKIESGFNTTDFKKNTLSDLLTDPLQSENKLTSWLDQFEIDSYRFSSLLQDQILIYEVLLTKLSESNIDKFKESLIDLGKSIQENYTLVSRHDVLLKLLSKIVLEFISADYSSISQLQNVLKRKKFKTFSILINELHKDLVTNFKDIDITGITPSQAAELTKCIESANYRILSL